MPRNFRWYIQIRFMVFNATFNNISVMYRGGQLYWWRKPEYAQKTTDLSQITDTLYHIMLVVSSTPDGTYNRIPR